ncbi:unnamed protein product [Gordionus sp. m RMFG-2023]
MLVQPTTMLKMDQSVIHEDFDLVILNECSHVTNILIDKGISETEIDQKVKMFREMLMNSFGNATGSEKEVAQKDGTYLESGREERVESKQKPKKKHSKKLRENKPVNHSTTPTLEISNHFDNALEVIKNDGKAVKKFKEIPLTQCKMDAILPPNQLTKNTAIENKASKKILHSTALQNGLSISTEDLGLVDPRSRNGTKKGSREISTTTALDQKVVIKREKKTRKRASSTEMSEGAGVDDVDIDIDTQTLLNDKVSSNRDRIYEKHAHKRKNSAKNKEASKSVSRTSEIIKPAKDKVVKVLTEQPAPQARKSSSSKIHSSSKNGGSQLSEGKNMRKPIKSVYPDDREALRNLFVDLLMEGQASPTRLSPSENSDDASTESESEEKSSSDEADEDDSAKVSLLKQLMLSFAQSSSKKTKKRDKESGKKSKGTTSAITSSLPERRSKHSRKRQERPSDIETVLKAYLNDIQKAAETKDGKPKRDDRDHKTRRGKKGKKIVKDAIDHDQTMVLEQLEGKAPTRSSKPEKYSKSDKADLKKLGYVKKNRLRDVTENDVPVSWDMEENNYDQDEEKEENDLSQDDSPLSSKRANEQSSERDLKSVKRGTEESEEDEDEAPKDEDTRGSWTKIQDSDKIAYQSIKEGTYDKMASHDEQSSPSGGDPSDRENYKNGDDNDATNHENGFDSEPEPGHNTETLSTYNDRVFPSPEKLVVPKKRHDDYIKRRLLELHEEREELKVAKDRAARRERILERRIAIDKEIAIKQREKRRANEKKRSDDRVHRGSRSRGHGGASGRRSPHADRRKRERYVERSRSRRSSNRKFKGRSRKSPDKDSGSSGSSSESSKNSGNGRASKSSTGESSAKGSGSPKKSVTNGSGGDSPVIVNNKLNAHQDFRHRRRGSPHRASSNYKRPGKKREGTDNSIDTHKTGSIKDGSEIRVIRQVSKLGNKAKKPQKRSTTIDESYYIDQDESQHRNDDKEPDTEEDGKLRNRSLSIDAWNFNGAALSNNVALNDNRESLNPVNDVNDIGGKTPKRSRKKSPSRNGKVPATGDVLLEEEVSKANGLSEKVIVSPAKYLKSARNRKDKRKSSRKENEKPDVKNGIAPEENLEDYEDTPEHNDASLPLTFRFKPITFSKDRYKSLPKSRRQNKPPVLTQAELEERNLLKKALLEQALKHATAKDSGDVGRTSPADKIEPDITGSNVNEETVADETPVEQVGQISETLTGSNFDIDERRELARLITLRTTISADIKMSERESESYETRSPPSSKITCKPELLDREEEDSESQPKALSTEDLNEQENILENGNLDDQADDCCVLEITKEEASTILEEKDLRSPSYVIDDDAGAENVEKEDENFEKDVSASRSRSLSNSSTKSSKSSASSEQEKTTSEKSDRDVSRSSGSSRHSKTRSPSASSARSDSRSYYSRSSSKSSKYSDRHVNGDACSTCCGSSCGSSCSGSCSSGDDRGRHYGSKKSGGRKRKGSYRSSVSPRGRKSKRRRKSGKKKRRRRGGSYSDSSGSSYSSSSSPSYTVGRRITRARSKSS